MINDSVRAIVIELRAYLERTRRSVNDEIRSYPTPIPRCDAQFNYLYEQRSRLSQALTNTDAMIAEAVSPAQLADAIADFTGVAACLDDAEEESLRRRLRDELQRIQPARVSLSTDIE